MIILLEKEPLCSGFFIIMILSYIILILFQLEYGIENYEIHNAKRLFSTKNMRLNYSIFATVCRKTST